MQYVKMLDNLKSLRRSPLDERWHAEIKQGLQTGVFNIKISTSSVVLKYIISFKIGKQTFSAVCPCEF